MKIEEWKAQILACRDCGEKFGYTSQPVFFGRTDSKIMQIGQRLREEWYQISDEQFYNQKNFYIVSTAHCYPERIPAAVTGCHRRAVRKSGCIRNWRSLIIKSISLLGNMRRIITVRRKAHEILDGHSQEIRKKSKKSVLDYPYFFVCFCAIVMLRNQVKKEEQEVWLRSAK